MADIPELLIEIIEIEPEAVHEETIYDQTVVARLQDGTKIDLFDKTMPVIEGDMVNDIINVCVHLQPATGVEKIENEPLGIDRPANASSRWSYDFIGRILEIDPDSRSVLFDIGTGTVAIIYYDNETGELIESNKVSVDDQLYISDCRMDIIEIN